MTTRSMMLGWLGVLLSAGCGGDGSEEGEDDAVARSEHAIAAGHSVFSRAGIVSVTVAGDDNVHTGLVIRADPLLLVPTMALTSARWVGTSTPPANLTVEAGNPGGSPRAVAAKFVNTNAYHPTAAILQTAPLRSRVIPLDTRSGAAMVGAKLQCFEYVTRSDLQMVDVKVGSASGDDLTVTSLSSLTGRLEDLDAGAVCLDTSTGAAVGQVTGAVGNESHVRRYASMTSWIEGMKNLAAVRADSGSVKLALYTNPPGRMCLDIPYGSPFDNVPINQFPCHYAANQAFWLDYRADASRPSLVSEVSGRCLDVPGSERTSGTNLQQLGCLGQLNQQLDLSLWSSGGGWRMQLAHAPSSNLCVSVEGGPSTTRHPTEQRTCHADADQRWYPAWL